MVKVSMTGEGPTDYGQRNFDTINWGPAYYYVVNALGKDSDKFEFVFVDKREYKQIKIQGRRKGREIPSAKFHAFSRSIGCNAGIFYSDADRQVGKKNDSKEAIKWFNQVYDEVSKGLAGSSTEVFIPMIPLRMIENWQLSDKKALERVYSVVIDNKDMPRSPEFEWGDENDPDSRHPKNLLRAIIGGAKGYATGKDVNRDTMKETAQLSDVNVLKEKCPVSYVRFYEDIMKLSALCHETE